MRSRTPPISSEFRGGGLEPPNPPPSVRLCLGGTVASKLKRNTGTIIKRCSDKTISSAGHYGFSCDCWSYMNQIAVTIKLKWAKLNYPCHLVGRQFFLWKPRVIFPGWSSCSRRWDWPVVILSAFSRKWRMCVHGNGLSRTIKGLRKYTLSKGTPTPPKYVVKNMSVLELYACARALVCLCVAFWREFVLYKDILHKGPGFLCTQ